MIGGASRGSKMDGISLTLESLIESFFGFLPKLLTALVIFVIALVIAGFLSRALQRAFRRRQADPEITLLAGKITRWMLIIFGTVIALEQVDFDVTTFLAGLGILGFTVGFAVQDVSKNFVAGLLLLLQQPFDIGDTITVSSFTGVVRSVDLRATELRTLDGLFVQIPNSDVFTSPIVNHSRAENRRIQLDVGVSYDSDPEQVRRVALNAIQEVKGLVDTPVPEVVFHTFGGSTIDLTIYYWFDTSETNPQRAKDQGVAAIKRAFEQAGIEMPFPTQVVVQQ